MTVCRYFLKGCCRFGDKCRYKHTVPYSSYQEESPRRNQHKGYSNRSSFKNGFKRNYNDKSKSFYSRRNLYIQHDDHYRSNYNQQIKRNQSNGRYQPEIHGLDPYKPNSTKVTPSQNKQEYVSEEVRGQGDQRRNREAFHNTSNPKDGGNFSDRNSASLKRTAHSAGLGEILMFVELIKEDIKECELGSQWPFSCYSPIQERSSFPGFSDISPEELRYEAYKASETNTVDSYLKAVENILQNINSLKSQLKNPSVELLPFIDKFCTGKILLPKDKLMVSYRD